MSFEFNSYGELETYLEGQLRPGHAYGMETSLQMALRAKQAIADAVTHGDKMAAVARYGVEMRLWHQMLILHCTHIALKGAEVSRTNVRHWQKRVFGKSMASSELHRYADGTRSAGYKVGSLLPSDPQAPLPPHAAEAQAFYARYKDALRIKVKSYR